MRIAVLSDIHSNYIALKACIDTALSMGAHAFLFLGDYNGDLAHPHRTMEILYDLKERYPCYFIKGNKENYWISRRQDRNSRWREYDSTTGCLFYTWENLTPEDLDFFEGLPHHMNLSFPGLAPLTLCHGSPDRVNEDLLPGCANTRTVMERDPGSFLLCGHTHRQYAFRHQGKWLLNPGSVGMPLNSRGHARFMLLHGKKGGWEHTFLSPEYDVDAVIRELHTSGLYQKAPCWSRITEHLLRFGTPSHALPLRRAMELCRKTRGECVWPDILEECWEQAVREALGEEE